MLFYERAQKEVEAYFDDPPEPETEAEDRLEGLVALIDLRSTWDPP